MGHRIREWLYVQRGRITRRVRRGLGTMDLRIGPEFIFVFSFAAMIALGTMLLMLPIATRDGQGAPVLTALFTATSASCVTGLIVEDTWLYWTGFGQGVILVLIQIGGFGFMTLMTLVALFMRRSIGLKSRLIIVKSLNLADMDNVRQLLRVVLCGTLLVEGIGAVLLGIRFAFDFGLWQGLARGVFHSVSAFCNAGFDLMGCFGAFGSMAHYVADPFVNLVLTALVTIGGLGFLVWADIWEHRGLRGLSIHSKLVLSVSMLLLFGGAVLIYLFECTNPETIGSLGPVTGAIAALFQSMTARTAGFAALNQAAMTESARALMIVLMCIGGSPGSTAGGLKTATVAVLVKAAWDHIRGRQEVLIAGHAISSKKIMDALCLMVTVVCILFCGTLAIAAVEQLPFSTVLYETASAMATVGLSLGITPQLSIFSKLVLIAMMFMGRVGILSIGFILLSRRSFGGDIRHPDAKILIG